ncbi:MAG: hypothetical protein U0441_35050 [Polyangiaceae bacterium]
MSISPVSPVDLRSASRAAKASTKDAALERAASEMESVFVRHLLEAAKIGGENNESGYGSMAVDALASGIQQGGGLGLTRSIMDALNPHRTPPPAMKTNPAAPPASVSQAAAGTKAE